MLRLALGIAIVVSLVFLPGVVARADDTADGASVERASDLAAPSPRVTKCAALDAVGIGIDPVVAPHVTARIRTTVEAMGYTLVSPTEIAAARQSLGSTAIASPADLWRLTFVSGAARGISARVYAASGQYIVEILVASIDGTGPFADRASAGASDLLDVVEALVRRLLPPASQFDADAAARLAEAARADAPRTTNSFRVLGPSAFAMPGFVAPTSAASLSPREPHIPMRRLAVGIGGDVSFGLTSDRFHNGFLDARFEYRLTRDFLIFAQVSYANLRGRTQRVSNVLPMGGLEARIRVASDDGVSIPLAASIGYLPNNCVVLRLAGGFNVPIKERFELGFDLLTPTFWFLKTGRVISFDLAVRLLYRFGPIKPETE